MQLICNVLEWASDNSDNSDNNSAIYPQQTNVLKVVNFIQIVTSLHNNNSNNNNIERWHKNIESEHKT